VTADDRVKYDAQFYQLQPVAGFLTGWYLEPMISATVTDALI